MVAALYLIISIGIITLYCILIVVYACYWKSIPVWISADNKILTTTVTLIIPARNEADNIINCLESALQQTYPKELLQILVVDDNSTDETALLVASFQQKTTHANIQLLQLRDDGITNSYKKKAISNGIEQATGELIITTDADCVFHKNWIASIVSYYQQYDAQLIAGPVCFHQEKNIFERFQTLEFIGLIGVGAAAIGMKKPTMCNGANMAYTKKAFYEVDGYNISDDIASGDDTFLLFKIAKRYPNGIHFIKSLQACVYTNAKPTLAEFVTQRKRWASKTSKYQQGYVKGIALLVYLANATVLVTALLCLFGASSIKLLYAYLAVKMLVDFVFLYFSAHFFNRKYLLWLFLPEQLFYTLYIVIVGAIAPFGKYHWKGRLVK